MAGDSGARRYLGDSERKKGNFERATKHYMISAGKSAFVLLYCMDSVQYKVLVTCLLYLNLVCLSFIVFATTCTNLCFNHLSLSMCFLSCGR